MTRKESQDVLTPPLDKNAGNLEQLNFPKRAVTFAS